MQLNHQIEVFQTKHHRKLLKEAFTNWRQQHNQQVSNKLDQQRNKREQKTLAMNHYDLKQYRSAFNLLLTNYKLSGQGSSQENILRYNMENKNIKQIPIMKYLSDEREIKIARKYIEYWKEFVDNRQYERFLKEEKIRQLNQFQNMSLQELEKQLAQKLEYQQRYRHQLGLQQKVDLKTKIGIIQNRIEQLKK